MHFSICALHSLFFLDPLLLVSDLSNVDMSLPLIHAGCDLCVQDAVVSSRFHVSVQSRSCTDFSFYSTSNRCSLVLIDTDARSVKFYHGCSAYSLQLYTACVILLFAM